MAYVEKEATAAVLEKTGPSKKDLNKDAKKLKREAYKSGGTEGSGIAVSQVESSPDDLIPTVEKTKLSEKISAPLPSLEIVYFDDASILLCRAVAAVLGMTLKMTKSKEIQSHLPYLNSPDHGSVSRDTCISRLLCRASAATGANGASLLCAGDDWLSSQVDQWLDYYVVNTGM
jgi:hypothetical protein